MDRNAYHTTEGSAKCPLRPKEMKLDFGGISGSIASNDDRFSENATRSEERRGFRPAPKLQALHLARGKARSGTVADISSSYYNTNNTSSNNSAGDATSAGPLTETPMKDTLLQGANQRQLRRRSLEFALTASSQLRLKAKAPAAGRHLRISETMPAAHSRTLWVEGNSVLHTEVGVAATALTHLSNCMSREQQIKEEWEAARLAKVRAFRAVVKAFMLSLTDSGGDARTPMGRGITDTIAVARCSVVTNTLVGTIQSFARAFRSRRLAAARGTLPLSAPLFRRITSSGDFGFTIHTPSQSKRMSTDDDDTSASRSCSGSDALDKVEMERLRQLYFDYFDCEAVSISSVVPSGAEGSVFGTDPTYSMSRKSSSCFMEDVDQLFSCASKTM